MRYNITHTIPVGGTEPIHAAHGSCWCFPMMNLADLMCVHNARDKREQFERQPGFVPDPEKSWVLVHQEVSL
jgi:hypothetical protein